MVVPFGFFSCAVLHCRNNCAILMNLIRGKRCSGSIFWYIGLIVLCCRGKISFVKWVFCVDGEAEEERDCRQIQGS